MSAHPALEALQAFFAHGAADQGLRSSWGPLADIALGGFGGTPDPERSVTDQRYRLGPGPLADSPIARLRVIRSTLAAMPHERVEVLYAAHGPTPWAQTIDAAFGRGMHLKVQKRLGDLAPVALLSADVREGWAAAPPPTTPQRQQWRSEGGWLVALCLSPAEADKATAARVKESAARMLREAEAVYLDRMGEAREVAVEARKERRPRPAPRRPMFDPFARPWEVEACR